MGTEIWGGNEHFMGVLGRVVERELFSKKCEHSDHISSLTPGY